MQERRCAMHRWERWKTDVQEAAVNLGRRTNRHTRHTGCPADNKHADIKA